MSRFLLLMGMLAVGGAGVGANDKQPEKANSEAPKPFVHTDKWINADLRDKIHTQSLRKCIPYKLEKDKSYIIEVASKYRACVRLENQDGDQLASDIDPNGKFGAAVIYRPNKTDEYQIIVTALNRNVGGEFTLTVRELTNDDGKPIELALENGKGTYRNQMLKTDPRYNGKIHKLLLVKFEAGKTYQIDHSSRDFDAFMILLGPDGVLVAQDDDSGGGPNGLDARIIYQAPKTGEYRVVVTSYNNVGIGNFSIMIQEKK